MTSRGFEDLVVWQRAIELCDLVYMLTRSFPRDEAFGLTSQMRRASVSVACNIAEGRGRGTRSDFKRFVYMAKGSIFELRTLVRIAANQGYMAPDNTELDRLITECNRMIIGLIRSLESPAPKRPPS